MLNNLPVDAMRHRCSGPTIASDVGLPVDLTTDAGELTAMSGWPLLWSRMFPSVETQRLPHIFEILMRTATLHSSTGTRA